MRVNIVDTRESKGVLPLARLTQLAQRIKPFGWHVEFLLHADEFPELDRLLAGFPVDTVFGYLGYMRTDKSLATLGFQALLRLLYGFD